MSFSVGYSELVGRQGGFALWWAAAESYTSFINLLFLFWGVNCPRSKPEVLFYSRTLKYAYLTL